VEYGSDAVREMLNLSAGDLPSDEESSLQRLAMLGIPKNQSKQVLALLRGEPNAEPLRQVRTQETIWKRVESRWYRVIESEVEIQSRIK